MKNNKNVKNVYMVSKYENTCRLCKKKVKVGQGIWWNKDNKQVSHKECFEKRGQKPRSDMGSRKGTERIEVRGVARQAGRNYKSVI